MSFDFHSAYVLSADEFPPQIVLGVHTNTMELSEGKEGPVVCFLLTSGRQPVRWLVGKPKESAGGSAVVDTDSGAFTIEPLTLEMWKALGESESVVGYDRLKDQFESDSDVQQFYVHNFLDKTYIDWAELQGAAIPS